MKFIPIDVVTAISDWQAAPPYGIIGPSHGSLFRLNVDLQSLCDDMRGVSGMGLSDVEVIKFLLRRNDEQSISIMLDIIRKLLKRRTDIQIIRTVFDAVNEHASQQTVVETYSSRSLSNS
jgi:hypothetical protein